MNSLLVGVGISDQATPGDDPVADAVTAEALGYDFVSAFDHPVAEAGMAEAIGYDAVPAAGHPVRTYPTYETQTLLTWIAARTTRIGLVPRVLGVPFRRPALIAKTAPTASSPAPPPTSSNSCAALPNWAPPALTSCPAGTSYAPSRRMWYLRCGNCARRPSSRQQVSDDPHA